MFIFFYICYIFDSNFKCTYIKLWSYSNTAATSLILNDNGELDMTHAIYLRESNPFPQKNVFDKMFNTLNNKLNNKILLLKNINIKNVKKTILEEKKFHNLEKILKEYIKIRLEAVNTLIKTIENTPVDFLVNIEGSINSDIRLDNFANNNQDYFDKIKYCEPKNSCFMNRLCILILLHKKQFLNMVVKVMDIEIPKSIIIKFKNQLLPISYAKKSHQIKMLFREFSLQSARLAWKHINYTNKNDVCFKEKLFSQIFICRIYIRQISLYLAYNFCIDNITALMRSLGGIKFLGDKNKRVKTIIFNEIKHTIKLIEVFNPTNFNTASYTTFLKLKEAQLFGSGSKQDILNIKYFNYYYTNMMNIRQYFD
ncbi:hypothetical protein SLOPH_545 [Spraguea lophii 42_110]|uniref:Uncharacterized protein n=1 Tax=Spraguea lophii (strain 42_110) TaxID=1358809 RepID=S7XG76_SPRLO|nr:hypothetical protein SLOPH_545 [Spraguea lophii 42_110]